MQLTVNGNVRPNAPVIWKNSIRADEAHGAKEKEFLWPWPDHYPGSSLTMDTQLINVSSHSAYTLKGLSVKWAHNALPKACGKLTWAIIMFSFPNKKGQFHSFQSSQLAFVQPIWHSLNAHMVQMPPSSLFLQFGVCLLSKGLSLPSVLSLVAHCSVGEEWRV